jgi:dolichol-phosphate mannosyltransferase
MIYIILPAFNENYNLGCMFEEVKKLRWSFKYQLIVVNDCSTDETAETCAGYLKDGLPVKIITHEVNKGMGSALRTGILSIKELNDDDIIVMLDADNTQPLDLIPEMTNKINSGFELVIASRKIKGGKTYGVPFVRSLVSRIGGSFLKLIIGNKQVNDYTCLFRAFKGSLVNKMTAFYKESIVKENDFAASFELLFKAFKFTDKICEIPLVLRYDNKIGPSKMKLLKTILNTVKITIRK